MTDHEWFAPKRYGFGAGLPIAWQGWAILLGYVALVAIAVVLFGREDARALVIIIPATVALVIVTALTTRGGWRWRWGDD